MKAHIIIDMNTPAFHDEPASELGRILPYHLRHRKLGRGADDPERQRRRDRRNLLG